MAGSFNLAGQPRADPVDEALELARGTSPETQAQTLIFVALAETDQTKQVGLLEQALELASASRSRLTINVAAYHLARLYAIDEGIDHMTAMNAIRRCLECERDSVIPAGRRYALHYCGRAFAARNRHDLAVLAWAVSDSKGPIPGRFRAVEELTALQASVANSLDAKTKTELQDRAAELSTDALIDRLLQRLDDPPTKDHP